MATSELFILPLSSAEEEVACANLMASSDPWVTLGRDFAASLQLIKNTARERYVAKVGDNFAGFLVLNFGGSFVGYLQTIAVAEPFRGKGIGSALVNFAEERIFRDHPNVFMCVSAFNTQARRLYRKLGYEEIGEIRNFLIDGQSEILIRKTRGAIAGYQPKPT
jgi:ribosomal protein S18 acetylase RimI-like enzyme